MNSDLETAWVVVWDDNPCGGGSAPERELAPFSTHTHGGWHSSTRTIADIEVEKKLREQRS
jgi:hypothetical protein